MFLHFSQNFCHQLKFKNSIGRRGGTCTHVYTNHYSFCQKIVSINFTHSQNCFNKTFCTNLQTMTPSESCWLLLLSTTSSSNHDPKSYQTVGSHWLSPTAILRRMHPIPSELGSQAAKGPVSTGVGDRPGSPLGAVGFLYLHFLLTEKCSLYCRKCVCCRQKVYSPTGIRTPVFRVKT